MTAASSRSSEATRSTGEGFAGDVAELCRVQTLVFGEDPPRRDVVSLPLPSGLAAVTVRVHRNHAFEHVAPLLRVYLALAGLDATFVYSDYDDALTFDVTGDADIELLWLDDTRYRLGDAELAEWIEDRLAHLRGATRSPIAVPSVVDRPELNSALSAIDLPDVHVVPLAAGLAGQPVFDDRRASVMGTRLNARGQLLAARVLGAALPGLVLPYRKAVAVDLDNTLYDGVLGEDGIDGVRLTDGHLALQRALVDLHGRGVLLTVVSKNEPADVAALFAARSDFALRADHVSSWQVGWDGKADGIRAAAAALAIAPDAFVFVDDNPGELADVHAQLPDVGLVYGGAGPDLTERALRQHPRLWPDRLNATDALRAADLRSRRQREELARDASDPRAYLSSLGVVLEFERNPREHRQRMAELSRKTNQFNLSLARLDETEVERYLDDPDRDAFTMAMRDRLSDSGIIGSILTRREGARLHVDELCVSCRALGRRLEDALIGSVLVMAAGEDVEEIVFHPASGDRNGPALAWLERITGVSGTPDGPVVRPFDRTGWDDVIRDTPVDLVWR